MLTLRSSHLHWVNALRADRASVWAQVLSICLFVVATAVGAKVRIYLWEIPLTLQTLFVYGSGLYLGARNGSISMVLYVCLGLFLPVYAGDGHGPSYLFGAASAGYLLGMPLSAMTIGMLSRRWNVFAGTILSTFAGSLVLFTCGVVWLHYAGGHATWWHSIDTGWLRFVGFDALKVLLVTSSYSVLRRFF